MLIYQNALLNSDVDFRDLIFRAQKFLYNDCLLYVVDVDLCGLGETLMFAPMDMHNYKKTYDYSIMSDNYKIVDSLRWIDYRILYFPKNSNQLLQIYSNLIREYFTLLYVKSLLKNYFVLEDAATVLVSYSSCDSEDEIIRKLLIDSSTEPNRMSTIYF